MWTLPGLSAYGRLFLMKHRRNPGAGAGGSAAGEAPPLGRETGGHPAEQPAPPPLPPTVWYHGERSYSCDGKTPFAVSLEQHNVLRAFLDRDLALDTKALKKAGASNPAGTVKKLAGKFGAAVQRAGARKGDGYRVRVRTLPAVGN
jgi:hypothetical protein